MPKKLCFAILNSANAEVREKHLQKLIETSEYSRVHEPGVLAYCVCVPREDDQSTIYMIEIYADEAAFDTHMQSAPVQAMVQWMEAFPPPLLTAPPTVLMLDIFDGPDDGAAKPAAGLVQRAAAAVDQAAADPYLIAAEIAYKTPQLLEQALPYWADVVAGTRANEPGVLVYTVARDPAPSTAESPNRTLYTFEAYHSKDYLTSVHIPSPGVQANVAATKDSRDGLKHHLLKRVGGFLSKI